MQYKNYNIYAAWLFLLAVCFTNQTEAQTADQESDKPAEATAKFSKTLTGELECALELDVPVGLYTIQMVILPTIAKDQLFHVISPSLALVGNSDNKKNPGKFSLHLGNEEPKTIKVLGSYIMLYGHFLELLATIDEGKPFTVKAEFSSIDFNEQVIVKGTDSLFYRSLKVQVTNCMAEYISKHKNPVILDPERT